MCVCMFVCVCVSACVCVCLCVYRMSNPDVSKFGEKLSKKRGIPLSDQSETYGSPSPSIRLVYEYYVNR